MDWKILEIKESLENKIKICENFMELCDSQIKNYKSRFETNSVNQAANYEYWKTCKVRTAYEIKDFKSGYYYVMTCLANDDKAIKEFDRLALISNDIVRHLITKLEK